MNSEHSNRDGQAASFYSHIGGLLAAAAIVVTVASQFAGRDLLVIYGPLWVFVAALNFHSRGSCTVLSPFSLFFLLSYASLASVCSVMFFVTGEAGYITNLFICITKVFLMYLVGMALSSSMVNEKHLCHLAYIYIAASVAYALWVHLNYIPSLSSWLSNEVYLFGQKNSFGQIISVAIILCAVIPKTTVKGRFLAASSAIYMFAILVAAQCRSSMIACAIALIAWLLIDRKCKLLFAALSLCVAGLVFSPRIQSVVSHAFLLDKYAGAGLSAISSGRTGYWADALKSVSMHPFFGVGDYYVDNFYLNTFANLGVMAGGLVVMLILVRFLINFSSLLKKRHGQRGTTTHAASAEYIVCILGCVLSVFYFVVSLFEALPPIGPGVCSFVFWIACGYLDEKTAAPLGSTHHSKTGEIFSR